MSLSGATVLVDSGLMRFEGVELDPNKCGSGGSNRALYGSTAPRQPAGYGCRPTSLTEKTRANLRAGVEAGCVRLLALSFGRKARTDIALGPGRARPVGSKARKSRKIEDQSGVRKLHSIVKADRRGMVDRGELGIEIDYHATLALVQRESWIWA